MLIIENYSKKTKHNRLNLPSEFSDNEALNYFTLHRLESR